jgi:GR25 family glycosyltransferase involved in LPS biosynthesis
MNVGDTIFFGNYEWIILEKRDNAVLVLSKDIIFQSDFHDKKEDIIWEKSAIRNFLNNDFYHKLVVSIILCKFSNAQ